MAAVGAIRTVPSVGTICKNRNICESKNSVSFLVFIYIMEVVFYILLLASVVVMFLGTYWIFKAEPQRRSDSVTTDCCIRYVYVLSEVVNVLQYLVYFFVAVYTVVVVIAIQIVDKKT